METFWKLNAWCTRHKTVFYVVTALLLVISIYIGAAYGTHLRIEDEKSQQGVVSESL